MVNPKRIEKHYNFLVGKNPKFKKFFLTELSIFAPATQLNNLVILENFFSVIDKYIDINEEDVLNFLESRKYTSLENLSKNMYLSCVKRYLLFLEKKELVKMLKYNKVKDRELNKNELITRDDLEKILSVSKIKHKCLVMVNYEGALRSGELVNIRYRDIQFKGGYANLYIQTSKTNKRNIPLIEAIPYLHEYFSIKNFKPDDKIFPYVSMGVNNVYLYTIKKVKDIFPDFEKKLYPHLLRHSRLTELANNKMLNEAQIRKFAGWSPGSAMPKIYFHLNDNDIINTMTEGEVIRPKPKKFKPKICDICNSENNLQNVFCWKCGNVFDKQKIITEKIGEQDRIEEMSKKIDKLEKIYEIFANSMNRKEE